MGERATLQNTVFYNFNLDGTRRSGIRRSVLDKRTLIKGP